MRLPWLPNRDMTAKFSWLALIETLLASGLMWIIAIRYEHLWYLLVSATVAPLLLLRNPYSTKLGVRWYRAYLERMNHRITIDVTRRFNSGHRLALYVPVTIQATILKVRATIHSLFVHTLLAIRAIPRNWSTVCFRSDLFTEIDAVPGLGGFPLITRHGNRVQLQICSVQPIYSFLGIIALLLMYGTLLGLVAHCTWW